MEREREGLSNQRAVTVLLWIGVVTACLALGVTPTGGCLETAGPPPAGDTADRAEESSATDPENPYGIICVNMMGALDEPQRVILILLLAALAQHWRIPALAAWCIAGLWLELPRVQLAVPPWILFQPLAFAVTWLVIGFALWRRSASFTVAWFGAFGVLLMLAVETVQNAILAMAPAEYALSFADFIRAEFANADDWLRLMTGLVCIGVLMNHRRPGAIVEPA